MRLVVNAILYVVVGSIQLHVLPKEYPKRKSAHHTTFGNGVTMASLCTQIGCV